MMPPIRTGGTNVDLGLDGRVAIVGGASKGMGNASARALAREGARVVMVARGAEALDGAAQTIATAHGTSRVLAIAADLSVPSDVERVAREARAWGGRIDVVVNNLGGPPPGETEGLADEQWHAALELNFFSAVRLNRLVLPLMREGGYGRIVTVLSLSIKQPEENLALSTVSRTAAAAYTKVLSTEVAHEGITVNNVLPGSIATERLQAVAEMQAKRQGEPLERALDIRRGLIPAGRFGAPEEVADVICFLASAQAGFITGQSIVVDGGQLRAMA